jgi:hypothetical protein
MIDDVAVLVILTIELWYVQSYWWNSTPVGTLSR